MIDTKAVTFPRQVLKDETKYNSLCFIYVLIDPRNGQPFYAGSSTNFGSRYLVHLLGDCVDTRDKVAELAAEGLQPDMQVVDISTRKDRLIFEARYMSLLVERGYEITNTSRYPAKVEAYAQCPTCYRSQRNGNLMDN